MHQFAGDGGRDAARGVGTGGPGREQRQSPAHALSPRSIGRGAVCVGESKVIGGDQPVRVVEALDGVPERRIDERPGDVQPPLTRCVARAR